MISNMRRKLVYISIIASMIGSANVLSIDLSIVQLSIFRLSIILILLSMIVRDLLVHNTIKINKKILNNYSIKFMFIWFMYALFSLAWVEDYNAWIKASIFLGIGLITCIILSQYINSTCDLLLAFRLISIMVLVHNILGWYEIKTGNYLFLSIDRIANYAKFGYPVTTFGNTMICNFICLRLGLNMYG